MTTEDTGKHYAVKAEWKNFARPDEVREFPKGRLELMRIGGAIVVDFQGMLDYARGH
ncbi:MAG TPA: hypothetical protein VFI67_11970 [Sphingomicrobium sp.]|nr:hypothetical protein [Sphingomicrobium sp.]